MVRGGKTKKRISKVNNRIIKLPLGNNEYLIIGTILLIFFLTFVVPSVMDLNLLAGRVTDDIASPMAAPTQGAP
ncbi:MAG: hypothetical protein Q8Q35_02630, partial [Nanoarchaeota archaeon]|nr:hypothetical protein [Nanoarchaeota archaeon]